MAEYVGAPLVSLSSTGYLLTITDDVEPGRLPIPDVKVLTDLAASALQPGDLGSAAGAETTDFMLVADHEAIVASLIARLEVLEASGGYDELVVYEATVFDSGVFV